jgi:mannose-6-phosphate isomerase
VSQTGPRVDKPWGHELIWALTDRYCGKILLMKGGNRLSLQRHVRKDESILVLSGHLRLYLERPGEHGREGRLAP